MKETSLKYHLFLVVDTRLYTLPCRLVRPSIPNFLGSGPKRSMSCRTQEGISRCLSFRLSICPPHWPSGPQICPPSPKFSPSGLKSAFQASDQPPPCLKSDLQTSDLPSRPLICPPSIKSALCGSNLPSKPQICSPSLNSALQPSNMPSLA